MGGARLWAVWDLARCWDVGRTPGLPTEGETGDLLIGNHNFGYGHPHYPPMIGMRQIGIGGVIAESFSPGYWRGEIAMGFPQVECPGVLEAVSRWDEIEVDWASNTFHNHTTGVSLPIEPLSDGDRLMLEAGMLQKDSAERLGVSPGTITK